MKITKAIRSKKGLMATITVCGLGIFLISSPFLEPDQTTEFHKAESTTKPVYHSVSDKSTHELINQAAQKTFARSTDKTVEYPNVTPTYLVKPFSPTLEGTDIDGQIKVGEDGKIMLNIAVKDFFDYFLSAVGEVLPELALDELLRVASESLPPENFLEVQALLDNYLAYKEQAVALMSQPMLPQGQQTREYQLQIMQDSLTQLRQLRRENMPEAQVDAFFGLEEAYEDYTLATVKVQFDDTMSDKEKATLMQYHRSLLPDPIRSTETQVISDSKKNAEIHKALSEDDEGTLVSQLDSHGYSDEQKEEILDFKRSQVEFDRRYQEYKEVKASRLSKVTSEAEQAQIVDSLQSEYFFTEQELTQAKVRDLRT